jgi:hypothetical protein
MALVTYLIGSCSGGPAILVDFDSGNLPSVNGNYYLTFTGGTTEGCYDIIDNAEPATGVDKVATLSIDYGDCTTCQNVPSPTPTSTKTPTPTSTKTPTPTKTPTQTPTNTTTPTQTPTNTTTPTKSVTPTNTTTPTKSVTPTQTPTQTPTNTTTPTLTKTPTQTPTKSVTPTQTPTKSVTPTQTPTNTPTDTPASTPKSTPTPTPTSAGEFFANLYYQTNGEREGSFSGGTWSGPVPHPEANSNIGQDGKVGTIYEMNAVKLGGFNGLNN